MEECEARLTAIAARESASRWCFCCLFLCADVHRIQAHVLFTCIQTVLFCRRALRGGASCVACVVVIVVAVIVVVVVVVIVVVCCAHAAKRQHRQHRHRHRHAPQLRVGKKLVDQERHRERRRDHDIINHQVGLDGFCARELPEPRQTQEQPERRCWDGLLQRRCHVVDVVVDDDDERARWCGGDERSSKNEKRRRARERQPTQQAERQQQRRRRGEQEKRSSREAEKHHSTSAEEGGGLVGGGGKNARSRRARASKLRS